ncbi:hypothetical protein HDU67_008431 [Dinochytrium kinnereticum]|nr:hypothetical protein HDU67_008431 [Dinochytrium kinnereticum]
MCFPVICGPQTVFAVIQNGGSADGPSHFVGYHEQQKQLEAWIDTCFFNEKLYSALGLPLNNTAVVTGPAGVGKSSCIRKAINSIPGVRCVTVLISEIVKFAILSETSSESVNEEDFPLLIAREAALESAPSVLMLEGLDLLCKGSPLSISSSIVKRIIDSLLPLQNLNSRVCIVSSCSSMLELPFTIRRFFHNEIKFGAPSLLDRKEISSYYLDLCSTKNTESRLEDIAKAIENNAAGFTGRDIRNLVAQAVQNAILRNCAELKPPEPSSRVGGEESLDDLASILTKITIRPCGSGESALLEKDARDYSSSLNEIQQEAGTGFDISWQLDGSVALKRMQKLQLNEEGFEMRKPDIDLTQVAGYLEVRKRLHNLISFPIEYKDTYTRLGVTPPSGILLFGPSGCGKTYLVHALASTLAVNFIAVKGKFRNKLYSKYFGETEERLRKVFGLSQRMAPCILFFDDLDTIGTRREWGDDGVSGLSERILSTLLNEMDGVSRREGVIVIGTTNQPEKLDDALLRPDRLSILSTLSPPLPHDDPDCPFSDETPWDPRRCASLTEGYTPSDLRALLRESSLLSLREYGATRIKRYLLNHIDEEDWGRWVVGFAWKHVAAALGGALVGGEWGIERGERVVLAGIGESSDEERAAGKGCGWWRPANVSAEDVERFKVFKDGKKK